MSPLTASQLDIIRAPLRERVFLSGPAGCGKTTAGVERTLFLLENGIPADRILVLTPQRTLQDPYISAINQPDIGPGGQLVPATVGGLARRMVDLFWPVVVEEAGFAHTERPPVFLTLETAQYYMASLVRPLLDEGYFDSLIIDRNRLFSQIIDNLNKSAAVGFPYSEIGERLISALPGEPAQRRVYEDAQECATRFRQFCLAHNLLDFSLQLEIFWTHLWPQPMVREHLSGSYRHLVYDNIEEDFPRAHDLVREWLPDFDSAVLVYDEGGGYRQFLGADPDSGWDLNELCDRQARLEDSFVASPEVVELAYSLGSAIRPAAASIPAASPGDGLDRLAFPDDTRFFPQMLDWVAAEVQSLIEQDQVAPQEIVILAPYVSDALRFSLLERLTRLGVPARSHRPSRSLRDEPATQALLTLACLAHPHWGISPSPFDVTYAFMLALDMDLVRAHLLAEIVYRHRDLSLSAFEAIVANVQERITYQAGNRFSSLREWISTYREEPPLPLDHFMRRLFGEVLSQPGYGFHTNLDAVRVAASLVESVNKFRLATEPAFNEMAVDPGREYLAMLQDGVIAAQYLESWRTESDQAVLVAPAYTFLMMNRPAAVQFWLDPGSGGWSERLSQPLTQPYVLSRHWDKGRQWTDADEVAAERESLARLVSGLLQRCRDRVYLGFSDLGESGYEQRGALLKSIQKVLTAATKK